VIGRREEGHLPAASENFAPTPGSGLGTLGGAMPSFSCYRPNKECLPYPDAEFRTPWARRQRGRHYSSDQCYTRGEDSIRSR